MPYGEPTPTTNSATYSVVANHDNGAQVVLSGELDPASTDAQKDEAVQALVDALEAAPALTLVYAQRSYPTTQQITPA